MDDNLKRRVLARVYLEYAKNIFLEYPDYFMFSLFVVTSFTLISVHSVLINISNIPKYDLPYAFNFFMVALLNTKWIIQLLIVGFFVRVIVSGIRFGYKNIYSKRWFLSRLLKLRY